MRLQGATFGTTCKPIVHYPWEPLASITMMQDVLGAAVALLLTVFLRERYLSRTNLHTRVTPDKTAV
jgi:hypothetical protein